MSFLRQYVAPLFIVLIFLLAMVAVSARIFLPSDLAAPAPIEDPSALAPHPYPEAVAIMENVDIENAATTIAQFYSSQSSTATKESTGVHHG